MTDKIQKLREADGIDGVWLIDSDHVRIRLEKDAPMKTIAQIYDHGPTSLVLDTITASDDGHAVITAHRDDSIYGEVKWARQWESSRHIFLRDVINELCEIDCENEQARHNLAVLIDQLKYVHDRGMFDRFDVDRDAVEDAWTYD